MAPGTTRPRRRCRIAMVAHDNRNAYLSDGARAARFDASALSIGIIFFAPGVLQTLSMMVAGRLGERFGLLATMVPTLPEGVEHPGGARPASLAAR